MRLVYEESEKDQDWIKPRKGFIKASFGGDRSAAGRYAAEQRWKHHRKKDDGQKNEQGESLDDEVKRVSAMLRGVTTAGGLPRIEFAPSAVRGLSGEVKIITPEEYASYRGAQMVFVKMADGKKYLVVTQPVLEAEEAVRALGARALKQVHAELVASGKITQQQLDDATAFMASRDKPTNATNEVVERALAGDSTLPQVLLTQAETVKRRTEQAKKAKGELMKASRAYNEARRTLQYDDPELRRLWEARRDARHANSYAKIDLRRAEEELRQYAGEFEGEKETLVRVKDEDAMRKNAIMVQGLVGERVKELLAGRRVMADKIPTLNDEVTVPRGVLTSMKDGKATTIDNDARARDILAEVTKRFPEALVDRLQGNFGGNKVRIIFTSSGGGSYSSQNNTIRADMDDADTMTHESVHGISYQSQETRLLEQAALQRRIFGKETEPKASFADKLKIGLQKIIGASTALGWKFEGSYIKDDFVAGYQGRLYDYERQKKANGGKVPTTVKFDGPTEILTVATENVFGGGFIFKQSGKLDAELTHLSLGWLLAAEGGQ